MKNDTGIVGQGEAISSEYLYALIKSGAGSELPIDMLLYNSGVNPESYITGFKSIGHIAFRIIISNILKHTTLKELISGLLNYVDSLDHGPLSIVIQSSKTFEDALKVIAYFADIRTAGKRYEVVQRDGRHWLILKAFATPIEPNEEIDKFIVISSLLGTAQVLQPHLQGQQEESIVSFDFSFDDAESFIQSFSRKGIRILFEQGESSISWPDDSGWQPRTTDPKIIRYAENQINQQKVERKETGLVEARVRFELSKLGKLSLNLESVAETLNMSSRNLQRKLTSEGTSFREIRTGEILKRARHSLEYAEMSVESVASELGYSHPSNFIKAFKNYFGCLPSDVRYLGDKKQN